MTSWPYFLHMIRIYRASSHGWLFSLRQAAKDATRKVPF